MKKLIYISSIAAPHQVKLSIALQKYFDAYFVFYEGLGARAAWWKIPLPGHCEILPGEPFKVKGMRLTVQHLRILREKKPDIVMLGGFSAISNILAYWWARRNNKKTVVFTERSRDSKGRLRPFNMYWKTLRWIYRNVDLVMVSANDTVPQFRDDFRFGDRVIASQYAADIDSYFGHKERSFLPPIKFMFANRLVETYNPIGAINIFFGLLDFYPRSTLVMNAVGPMREQAEKTIKELGISSAVFFLDNIASWNDLNLEYLACDVMLLPATFSNGNFTIIEAMASGMGIVISDKVLGVGKLVKNGVNGYRVPPNKTDFIAAVRQLIDDPERTRKWAKENRKIVIPMGVEGTAALYAKQLNERLF